MKDFSSNGAAELTALVGSRLCHDLINPLGAIGNGVELLAMMPGHSKPEVTLIEEAVRDAQARIRFFRIAFGHADNSGRVTNREIHEIIAGLYGNDSRLSVEWQSTQDLVRTDAKIGLLMLSCAEHALPLGGTLRIMEADSTFRLEADAKRISCDGDLWGILRGQTPRRNLVPSEVQFELLAKEAKTQDRVVRAEWTDDSLMMSA